MDVEDLTFAVLAGDRPRTARLLEQHAGSRYFSNAGPSPTKPISTAACAQRAGARLDIPPGFAATSPAAARAGRRLGDGAMPSRAETVRSLCPGHACAVASAAAARSPRARAGPFHAGDPLPLQPRRAQPGSMVPPTSRSSHLDPGHLTAQSSAGEGARLHRQPLIHPGHAAGIPRQAIPISCSAC